MLAIIGLYTAAEEGCVRIGGKEDVPTKAASFKNGFLDRRLHFPLEGIVHEHLRPA